MSTIRTIKNKDYSVICNTFVRDERLSWKAKGILAYLLSKPDNWQIKVADLIKRSHDGRESVYAGVKELLNTGYLQRLETRLKGKITSYEYVLYESGMPSPLTGNPDTVKPDSVLPDTGKPDTYQILMEANTEKEKILTDEVLTADAKSVSQSDSIFGMCRVRNKSIRSLIEKALKIHPEEYVSSQVEYVNARCRLERGYRKLLDLAIQNDYGSAWKDDEALKAGTVTEPKQETNRYLEGIKAEVDKKTRIKKFLSEIGESGKAHLEGEFLSTATDNIRKAHARKGFKDLGVKLAFEEFITLELSEKKEAA